MFSAAKEHTIRRISETPLRMEPFPHLVVNEVFPPAFYAEMQRRKMADADYVPLNRTGRVSAGYSPARLCFVPPKPDNAHATSAQPDSENVKFWMDFFAAYDDAAFRQAWVTAFADSLAARVRQDPALFPNGTTDIRSEFLLMRDKENYVLTPHTDAPSKLISALFYLPPDDSGLMLGTSLYEIKDKTRVVHGGYHEARDGFELIATLPYRANTMLAFPNLKDSFHGVEPLDGPRIQRDILLYDIKLIHPKAQASAG